MWDLSSPTRDWTYVTHTARWILILNYWTIREGLTRSCLMMQAGSPHPWMPSRLEMLHFFLWERPSQGEACFARALGEEQGSNKPGRGLCKYTEHRLGSKNLGVTPGTKYLRPFASTFWCLLPWSGALWNQSPMEMIIMFKVLLNKQFHLDS